MKIYLCNECKKEFTDDNHKSEMCRINLRIQSFDNNQTIKGKTIKTQLCLNCANNYFNKIVSKLNQPKTVKPIILDDNPLSMACYMAEHPEFVKELDCTHVAKGESEVIGCGKEVTYKYHSEGDYKTKIGVHGICGEIKPFPNPRKERILCKDCKKAVKDGI